MSNSFFRYLYSYFIIILVLTLFIAFSVIQISECNSGLNVSLDGEYVWPVPGHTYISSYFGYRNSPTAGASTYHSGIDIPAPSGTNILSISDGVVTFASWGAGGGYTIVIESEDIKVSYCHVSPIFIIERDEEVKAGQVISTVGPKNVYGINNNPYKDSDGNPTNGATTGCHLHLTIKREGVAVNPLDFFDLQ